MIDSLVYYSEYIIAVFGAFIFYKLVINFNWLNRPASYLASVFGLIIFFAGGLLWLAPMFFFFFSSSLLSSVGKNQKIKLKSVYKKASKRDTIQVFANGFCAVLIAMLHIIDSSDLNYLLFLASISVVNADTWATETGFFSKRNPRLLTSFKEVAKGRSGAVSVLGTMAALTGSFLIASFAVFLTNANGIWLHEIFLIGLSGFLGAIVDSFLGATIQAQYLDQDRKITENRFKSTGTNNKLMRGFSIITNDMVNLISSFTGPLFYLIIRYSVA
jgi:uncharacterized protein (TIGR00297 family)